MAFACQVDFSNELNPKGETNSEARRFKEILVSKIMKSVQDFMGYEVQPEFSEYPLRGVQPTHEFKDLDRGAKLYVNLTVHDRGDMVQVAHRLQERLAIDLGKKFPLLRDHILVTVGPEAKIPAS